MMLAPQLRQSLEMLQVPILELRAMIQKEIEQNPTLEEGTDRSETLEIEPSQCVYLDDLGINCKPAAAMGMAAIKVSNEAQALTELSALIGLEL